MTQREGGFADFPAMGPAPSPEIAPRRSRLRWFWSVLVLMTCGSLLWGCVSVVVVPFMDQDLSSEEARRVMEKHQIRLSDSFELVRMRRFNCPALAGMCGYAGTYVAPADQFPDYQSIFTDPTYHRPLRKLSCADLQKQVGVESMTKRGDNAWNFDCTNAIELFASAPYDGFDHDYPELTIARDSQFATIYLYQRDS
ncbi:hypothetical protein [Nocardia brasiliensis]|uniref:hypothetical protein n=1 Tax=Nocardia brasiliensis TaxID=37326 RepID=UPI002456BE9C|nr:hypothetical protein [Nocardia brasiliensis]